MKLIHCLTLPLAGLILLGAPRAHGQTAQPNTLSESEKAAGWKLLFDGKSTEGWRGFKSKDFPGKGWEVSGGWLKKVPSVRGGDIVSAGEYDDFELSWEWTIAPKGNNGVKYFITESRNEAVGHEYQMMDDQGEAGKHSTGSFYDVLPPAKVKLMKAAGEVNQSRILVRGNHVEHWLNGAKVLEYELGSEEVLRGVAASKFKSVPGFGAKIKGRILLTDHNDGAAFRSIKIRVP